MLSWGHGIQQDLQEEGPVVVEQVPRGRRSFLMRLRGLPQREDRGSGGLSFLRRRGRRGNLEEANGDGIVDGDESRHGGGGVWTEDGSAAEGAREITESSEISVQWDDSSGGGGGGGGGDDDSASGIGRGCAMGVREEDVAQGGDRDDNMGGNGRRESGGTVTAENSPRSVAATSVNNGTLRSAGGRHTISRSAHGIRDLRSRSSHSPASTTTSASASSPTNTTPTTRSTRSSSNVSGDMSHGTASVTRHHYYTPGPHHQFGFGTMAPNRASVQEAETRYFAGPEGGMRWEGQDYHHPYQQRHMRAAANAAWDGVLRWDVVTVDGSGWVQRQEVVADGRGIAERTGNIENVASFGGGGSRRLRGQSRRRDLRQLHRSMFQMDEPRRRRRKRDLLRRMVKWVVVHTDRNERNWRRSTRRMRRRRRMGSDDGDMLGFTYEDLLELEERNVKRGLTRDEMESLEVIKVDEEMKRAGAKLKAGEDECRICLQKIDEADELIKLPCSHWYHRVCIRRWFQTNRTCPVCREEVERKNPIKT